MKVRNTYTSEKNSTADYFSFFRKIKRDHFIFFMCVVIATLFWFLIKLSDVYTVTYVFDVNYNNVPVEKRLTSITDSTLTIDVTARGFALVEMGFGREHIPLSIDLRKYQLIHDKGFSFYIYTQELRKRLANQLGVEETNIILSENRLAFKLEELQSKKVKVVPMYTLNFKDQFGAYMNPRIQPDMVDVYGPASALDTLSAVYTNNLILNDVDTDMKMSLELKNSKPELINYNISTITLEVDVERFTESSVTIPINLSANKIPIKTFPSSVKVFYKVAQKDFNLIQAAQFNVVTDLQGVKLKEVAKLHLILDRYPNNVSNIRLVPADAEFLILK